MQKTIKKLFRQNETYVFLILLALSFLIQARSGQFYTSNNIVDIASAMIVPGLFAVGEFLVILSGGIDVSFPALASLTAYATTKLFLDLDYQGSVLLPMLTAIVIGAVLGMFNGFFVSFLRLPAMIVTLGTASVFKGIMQGTLESKQLAVIPARMKAFGKQAIYTATNPVSGLSSKLPAAFLVFAGVLLLTFLVLRYTMFGRGIYAIGGNESAAYNAGFAVKRTKFLLYLFAGVIASAAGIIRVCMMQQCHPTNMLGMEMNIVAGVVLGGHDHRRRKGHADRLRARHAPDRAGGKLHDPHWRPGRVEGRVRRPPDRHRYRRQRVPGDALRREARVRTQAKEAQHNG